jgi:hypothetical protein
VVDRKKMFQCGGEREKNKEWINKIYARTKNKVKMGEKEANGLRRQRELDRAARLVPCYLRYITLAFANELVIVAKSEREMNEVMKNLGKYLRKKKLEMNVEKAKMIVFDKRKRKNEENDRKWEGRKKEQLMS